MFRKIRITSLATLFAATLVAQSTGIKVHIIDKATKAALPFVNVVVEQGDRQVAGTMTDDKGYAELKPLEPGTYNVRAEFLNYKDFLETGVQVNQDVLARIEVGMISIADTSIGTVTIVHYKTPLLMRGTQTGSVTDSEDIHHMAANDINSIAANTPGVASVDVGAGLNIGGARQDATLYIIDGQKVTADQNVGSVPIGLVDQETVITGGIPAKYGDVTGGIVEINTLSGANHFFGSVAGYTSDLFDSYGNNDVNWTLGGPLWSKIDSNKRKHTIVDFIFGGEYTYNRDANPSFIAPTYVNSSTLAQLQANPITPDPQGGFSSSADYITSSQMYTQSWHQNTAADVINLTTKLNFHLSDNLKITLGASYQYATSQGGIYSEQLFDPSGSALSYGSTTKGFVRLTQKFYTPVGKEKTSLIKNAFYSIQAEYSNTYGVTENVNFGNNYFDYGYVGQFHQYLAPQYAFEPNGTRGPGYYMTGYQDSAFTFKPSNLNPLEVNYTNDVIKGVGTSGDYQTIIPADLGLINGQIPQQIYSLWYNTGVSYPSYAESNSNHFRFTADFSAEIANNSIDIGFEYEQNAISAYSLNAASLWTLMRNIEEPQITGGFDTLHPIITKTGTYNTYSYNSLALTLPSQFDKSFRAKLGVGPDQILQPDDYAPSEFSLNMFSAADLIQNGGSLVSYNGYNYLGSLSSANPSINDFFNQTDANGNNTYPIGAYRPIYMAGYIQDHFDIKSMVFDVGLRVEQFNANEYELSDPYLLFPAYTAGSEPAKNLGSIPSDIGSNYVVYVNNVQDPTAIVGFRNGNNWYDAKGNLVADPTVIASATTNGSI